MYFRDECLVIVSIYISTLVSSFATLSVKLETNLKMSIEVTRYLAETLTWKDHRDI